MVGPTNNFSNSYQNNNFEDDFFDDSEIQEEDKTLKSSVLEKSSQEIAVGEAEGLVADAEAEHGILRTESGNRQVTIEINLKSNIAPPLAHDHVATVRESTINPRTQQSKAEIDNCLRLAQESFKTEQAIISKAEIKFEATLLENNRKLTFTSMKVKIKQIDHEIGTVDKGIHTTRIKIQKAFSNKIILTNGEFVKADASNVDHRNHIRDRKEHAITEMKDGELRFVFSSKEFLLASLGSHYIDEKGQKKVLTEKNSRVMEKHEIDEEDRAIEEIRFLEAKLETLMASREELIGQRNHLEEQRKNLLEEQRKGFEKSEELRASLTPRENPKLERESHRDHEKQEEVADKNKKAPGTKSPTEIADSIRTQAQEKKMWLAYGEEIQEKTKEEKQERYHQKDLKNDIEKDDINQKRIDQDEIDRTEKA